ncbi:MAG TPA: DegT/DnrJ/EryC1/StrS family aminotransferase [bacterium]|nr:DegT/DnrJ/EryC1/StrS family aminotransferase [bacterium]HOL34290.1 DegT/DnrJ/EryC1/StrS family aminotransferase [bacterium]HPP07654.1 DegT/DnrJ/EryC1/StrS family aminotransferase [bacterium]
MKKKIRLSRPCIENKDAVLDLARKILETGFFTQGKYVSLFENQIARYLGIKYAIAVSSGTAALHLSLIATGIKPGDEVIVPAYTFPATANGVELLNAKPVLVDVDLDTFNISTNQIETRITSRTKAIIPVHLFGNPANMDEILSMAKKYNLWVIEDAAGAFGSIYKGKKCGTIGNVGCFSWHPRKLITTCEGGMIVTNNCKIAEAVYILRNHGIKKVGSHYDLAIPGFNYRMNELEAILGLVQMKKIKKRLKERQKLAAFYLRKLNNIEEIAVQKVYPDCINSWQAFVIRFLNAKDQKLVMKKFQELHIETGIGTYALNLLSFYSSKYNLQPSSYPNAKNLYSNSLAIPFYNGMKRTDACLVVKILKDFLHEI